VVLLWTCKRFSSLFLQAFTGIETKNRFALKNSLGQQCYFAHEGDEIMGLVIRKNEVNNIFLRMVENYLRWQKRHLLLSSTWECSKHTWSNALESLLTLRWWIANLQALIAYNWIATIRPSFSAVVSRLKKIFQVMNITCLPLKAPKTFFCFPHIHVIVFGSIPSSLLIYI